MPSFAFHSFNRLKLLPDNAKYISSMFISVYFSEFFSFDSIKFSCKFYFSKEISSLLEVTVVGGGWISNKICLALKSVFYLHRLFRFFFFFLYKIHLFSFRKKNKSVACAACRDFVLISKTTMISSFIFGSKDYCIISFCTFIPYFPQGNHI